MDDKEREELEAIKKEWEEKCLGPFLKEKPERSEKFLTDIGIPIERVYTPLDLERINFDYEEDLHYPGHYPFTRGITPTMYRGEPFIIRAYSGFGDPRACNPGEPARAPQSSPSQLTKSRSRYTPSAAICTTAARKRSLRAASLMSKFPSKPAYRWIKWMPALIWIPRRRCPG